MHNFGAEWLAEVLWRANDCSCATDFYTTQHAIRIRLILQIHIRIYENLRISANIYLWIHIRALLASWLILTS